MLNICFLPCTQVVIKATVCVFVCVCVRAPVRTEILRTSKKMLKKFRYHCRFLYCYSVVRVWGLIFELILIRVLFIQRKSWVPFQFPLDGSLLVKYKRHIGLHFDTIWYDMSWYDVYVMIYNILHDMIYDMVWYDIWYGMIRYIIWYNMLWYGMLRFDIWYDTIWYMIWYDIFVNCNWVDTRWQ